MRALGMESIAHDLGPQAARGAILGDFFEQVVVGVEKKRKLGREFVDAEARIKRGLHVSDGVSERKSHFLDGGRARFANVVSGDRDGIPTWEVISAPGENVSDDAHRGAYGINVRAAGDVFLQNVILHGTGEFVQIRALFLRHSNIKTEKNRGRRVDGHGSGDFYERDAVEKHFHVFEGIDGHPDFADFAERERMVGVQADLRGEIERDGKASLAFAQEIAIAPVGFDCRAKAGVLAHGPEAAAIHGGVDAAYVRKFARKTKSGFGIPRAKTLPRIERVKWQARERGEFPFALGRCWLGFRIRHWNPR